MRSKESKGIGKLSKGCKISIFKYSRKKSYKRLKSLSDNLTPKFISIALTTAYNKTLRYLQKRGK